MVEVVGVVECVEVVGCGGAHQAGGSASSLCCPPPPGCDSRQLSLCRSFADRRELVKKKAEWKINTAFFRASPTASSAEAQRRSINLIKREF